MKIKKAIIPAAGLGTRFLPATKAQPKEMLPIVDKPTIQYIIEEAKKAGISELLIITGRNKRAIEDHFDKSLELEMELKSQGKHELLNLVEDISNLVDIHYIRQKEPKGLGHAVLCAKQFIGDEPFAVLLGDDIIHSEVPAIRQLMDIYEQYESPVIGVQKVREDQISSFGIISPGNVMDGHDGRLCIAQSLVEKPKLGEAPSNIAVLGRYIITPDIFEILENTKPGAGGEIQLTDALKVLALKRSMYCYDFIGKRYDVGDKLEFLKATVEFALMRDDLKKDFADYLQELVKSMDG